MLSHCGEVIVRQMGAENMLQRFVTMHKPTNKKVKDFLQIFREEANIWAAHPLWS